MRTFVAAVLLAAAPVLAASPVLEDVSVLPGSRPVVTIRLSAPAAFRARTLQANGIAPHRLYLDLAGTTLGPTAPRSRDGAGVLLRVRTGQFDVGTARVVLDLSGEMPFEVDAEGSTVKVTLSPPAAEAKSAAPAPPPVTETARSPAPPPPPAAKPAPEPPILAKPEPPTPAPAAPVVAKRDDAHETPPTAAPATAPVPTEPKAEPAPTAPPAEPAAPAPGTEPAAAAPATQPTPPPPLATEDAPALTEQPSVAVARPESGTPPPLVAEPESAPAQRAPLPATRRTTKSSAPPPPIASRPLVGPPVPDALTRPLTPQDVIVMSVPPSPATAASATTTTTIQPAPRARGASSATAGVTSADTAPAVPPAEKPPAPKPSTRVAPASTLKPLIVLDAGHGGRDPGAEGVGGVIEKDVVLKLTRVLAKRMTERLRVNVFLTRTDDSYVTIDRRLAFPSDAVLFLSLHANSCPDPSARGLEIFYGGGAVRPADTGGASPRAALLGKYLNDALNDRVGGVRGSARPGSFSILARNPLPSALIEIGYLTHPEEAELSQDSVYRDLMADAVVDGLEAFLRAAAPPL